MEGIGEERLVKRVYRATVEGKRETTEKMEGRREIVADGERVGGYYHTNGQVVTCCWRPCLFVIVVLNFVIFLK